MPLPTFKFRLIAQVLIVLGAIFVTSSVTARADQITVQGSSNPNVQATINIISLTNGSITFSVTNVLVGGVSSSLTGVGFDLPGTITANSPGVCGPTLAQCGNFGLAPVVDNTPGNVPQFNSASLDWAVITGPNFTGGNPPGIGSGQTATFTVTGNFTGLTQANFLAGVYVRFQAISDSQFPNVGSEVAHNPNTNTTVPEPASMLLLGGGLAGLAAGIRRRRSKSK